MAEDWAIDVRKYAPGADEGVIAAIARYCGSALSSNDASLVSFTDPVETDRVRENYLKQKLGLAEPDPMLDKAIAAVGQRLGGDGTRNRVTVYYLLAEHFGRLGVFGAGSADGVGSASLMMGAVPPAAAVLPRLDTDKDHRGVAATGYGDWVPLALLIFGGLALLWYLTSKTPAPVAPPAAVAVAPAAPAASMVVLPVPVGADVVEAVVAGEPMVSVYFDTAKAEIDPDFDSRTAALRRYFTSRQADHLQVSGFNDPRGNAAMNAELSKNRAFAVRDALVRLGVPLAAIALVKPADTSDDDAGSLAEARRVDVTVEDGPVPAAEVEPVDP